MDSLPEYYSSRAANRNAHEMREALIEVAMADKPHFDVGYWHMVKAIVSGIMPSALLAVAGGLSAQWGLIVGAPAAIYYLEKFVLSTEPRVRLMEMRNHLIEGFHAQARTIKEQVPDAKWNDELLQFTSREHPEMLDFSTLPPAPPVAAKFIMDQNNFLS